MAAQRNRSTTFDGVFSLGDYPCASWCPWVFPKTVKEALLSLRGSFVGKKKKIWNLVPLCIFWTIWKEIKCITLRERTLALQRLKNSFFYNLWSWNRLYLGEEASTLLDFLDEAVFCFFFCFSWLLVYLLCTF